MTPSEKCDDPTGAAAAGTGAGSEQQPSSSLIDLNQAGDEAGSENKVEVSHGALKKVLMEKVSKR